MKVDNMLRCVDEGDTYTQGFCPACGKIIEVYEDQWETLKDIQEEEGLKFTYSHCIYCGVKIDWRK